MQPNLNNLWEICLQNINLSIDQDQYNTWDLNFSIYVGTEMQYSINVSKTGESTQQFN